MGLDTYFFKRRVRKGQKQAKRSKKNRWEGESQNVGNATYEKQGNENFRHGEGGKSVQQKKTHEENTDTKIWMKKQTGKTPKTSKYNRGYFFQGHTKWNIRFWVLNYLSGQYW